MQSAKRLKDLDSTLSTAPACAELWPFGDQARLESINYILDLYVPAVGGFRFSKHSDVTVNATAIGVIGLEFLQALGDIDQAERTKISAFILGAQQPDGSFCDPLFTAESIATTSHDVAYFIEETTTYCQQALEALGIDRPQPRRYPVEWLNPVSLIAYFEQMDWRDPHLNSNRVMFVLSQFVHDIELFDNRRLLKLVDAALDWIDTNQSPETGLWGGRHTVPLSHAMAATFHFTFYYVYRRRPILYPDRIIDSCLALQRKDGLFSRGNEIGQTCLDYDALDLLAKATLMTDYRRDDIAQCFALANRELQRLFNEKDGGFVDCREAWVGDKRLPFATLYHTGLKICACSTAESNIFSTWFRWLAVGLTQALAKPDSSNQRYSFRPLPWLGYHDTSAIDETNRANQKAVTIGQFRASDDLRKLKFNSEVSWIGGLTIRSETKDPFFLIPLGDPILNGSVLFRAEILASESTTFQLFYKPLGQNGFSEDKSVRQSIGKGYNEIYILLPSPLHDHVRVDPASRPGFYSLISVEIFRLLNE